MNPKKGILQKFDAGDSKFTLLKTTQNAIFILERLGIKLLAWQEFRLANETKIARKKGGALFKYGERAGVADVIFGEEGEGEGKFQIGMDRIFR